MYRTHQLSQRGHSNPTPWTLRILYLRIQHIVEEAREQGYAIFTINRARSHYSKQTNRTAHS
jgi:hypothetical protein